VITIGEGIPTHACLYANAHALARYAAACHEASIVPIIEPEVLLNGSHTIERCEEATEATLRATYAALAAYKRRREHVILKASIGWFPARTARARRAWTKSPSARCAC
jgi:fructose-bisphosphate aldolase class I